MKKTALLTCLLFFVTLAPTALAAQSSPARNATPPGQLNKGSNSNSKAVQAQSNSNSNSNKSSSNQGPSEKSGKSMDIKDRIATAVGSLKSRHRHVIGRITALGTNSITLATINGTTINVTVDSNTKYFDWKGPKKAATLASLKVGDRLSVVGLSSGQNSGLAVLIYRLVEPERHGALFGTISAINIASSSALSTIRGTAATSSATVTLRLRTGTSAAVLINPNTKLKISGFKTSTLQDLKIGQKAVATGIFDNLSNLVAKHFVVLAHGMIKGNNPASGSATPATSSNKLR